MYRKHTKIGSIGIVLWMFIYICFIMWLRSLLPINFLLDIVFYPIVGVAWVPVAIKLIKYCNKDNEFKK